MARGFCPNQECPHIDFLDTERPCPTCGREAKELTPKEYWRTRTIKLMHTNEIAEIAEIQEVARRVLGEASPVPNVQEPERSSVRQDQEGTDEVRLADLGEPLSHAEEIEDSEPQVELVELAREIEEVSQVEGSLAVGAAGETPRGESVQAERAVQVSIEGSETAVERGAISAVKGSSELFPYLESESALSETAEREGRELSEAVSVIENVFPIEGSRGVGADLEDIEDEWTKRGREEGEGTETMEEVSEIQGVEEIEELEGETEAPTDAWKLELTELRSDVSILKGPIEEVAAPERLPNDGGVGRPASAVRIITFREGSMEIGICPYCGLFVKGRDLGRHKLKHRVRNALSLQT